MQGGGGEAGSLQSLLWLHMLVESSFVSGVTSRGCPLLGRLEHTALVALIKHQGYTSATLTSVPDIPRRKLFQCLIVLMVRDHFLDMFMVSFYLFGACLYLPFLN